MSTPYNKTGSGERLATGQGEGGVTPAVEHELLLYFVTFLLRCHKNLMSGWTELGRPAGNAVSFRMGRCKTHQGAAAVSAEAKFNSATGGEKERGRGSAGTERAGGERRESLVLLNKSENFSSFVQKNYLKQMWAAQRTKRRTGAAFAPFANSSFKDPIFYWSRNS
jgi:hypothetical protein